MKSHGMYMTGKLWLQPVPTKPIWTEDDVSRVIFAEDENIVYIGGTEVISDWIPVGSFFKDLGLATDPESGNPFLNRSYILNIINGNIVLTYEE